MYTAVILIGHNDSTVVLALAVIRRNTDGMSKNWDSRRIEIAAARR